MSIIRIMFTSFAIIVILSVSCYNFAKSEAISYTTLPTCCPLDLTNGTGLCSKKLPKGKTYKWNPPVHLLLPGIDKTAKFQLQQRDWKCRSTWNVTLFPMKLPNANILPMDYFMPDGYLKIGNDYYSPTEYCINGTINQHNVSNLAIKVCQQTCGEGSLCVRKCCPHHQLYSVGFKTGSFKGCMDRGQHSQYYPALYHNYHTKLNDKERGNMYPHVLHHTVKNFQPCPNTSTGAKGKALPLPFGEAVANAFSSKFKFMYGWKEFRWTKDGYLIYKENNIGRCKKIFFQDACADGIINYSDNETVFRNYEEQTILFACPLPKVELPSLENVSIIYGPLLIATSVFALLTIVVYLLLWKRQTFRGWIIVSQATSLFFTNIFLGMGHIIQWMHDNRSTVTPWCIFVGLAAHFFFLSMFCWILITGFDLWWTFREIKVSGSQSAGRRRLIMYSCFAWGFPTLVVIVGSFLQHASDGTNCGDDDMNLVTPEYGRRNCYLSSNALGPYLYYPASVMMALNFGFFCVTVYKFFLYRKSTQMATKDDSQKQLQVQSNSSFNIYMLSMKLFFVMGVTWIFEVISFFVSGSGAMWYWMIFDMVNNLRAVAFFVIFVCKPDILNALKDNYPILKPLIVPFTRIFCKKSLSNETENATMTTGQGSTKSFKSKASIKTATL